MNADWESDKRVSSVNDELATKGLSNNPIFQIRVIRVNPRPDHFDRPHGQAGMPVLLTSDDRRDAQVSPPQTFRGRLPLPCHARLTLLQRRHDHRWIRLRALLSALVDP